MSRFVGVAVTAAIAIAAVAAFNRFAAGRSILKTDAA
jgi:hypothetical protein